MSDELAIVVPHTHWDREWYAPFETMRFHLVRFLDELMDALERDPSLPSFLLDGQAVLVEDYLEIRPEQRSRIAALVAAGRLRVGPCYVQADEFLVPGEALVRNLLVGHQVARGFGSALREGYLPDVFGHVHQLPQILRGFGIETLYAMRGFGGDVDETGSEFWWEAPDGSRVLVHWLVDSYSNAAVLTSDAATMSMHHGVVVRYDSLFELLDRLSARSATGVLLLLNGGDHLRLQPDVAALVAALDQQVAPRMRLGGLEDFHRLARLADIAGVHRGELRDGRYHDVLAGVASTRTDLKRMSELTESRLSGLAERLDAVASLVDGRGNAAHLRYAWRELLKNYAHDSITGCSIDAVHDEMRTRFTKVAQVADAVADDALGRLAGAVAPVSSSAAGIPIVVVNPSPWRRDGPAEALVVPESAPPLGERRFGWRLDGDIDVSSYVLLDPDGRRVPFTVSGSVPVIEDILNRRKELVRDRIAFTAIGVPPLGSATYRLVPASAAPQHPVAAGRRTRRTARTLENEHLHVRVEPDGTLAVQDKGTGRAYRGLGELLDDADAGDEYAFSALPGDRPVSSTRVGWTVRPGAAADDLAVRGTLLLPVSLAGDGAGRARRTVGCPVDVTVRLPATSRSLFLTIAFDNRVRDHRLRVRFPTGVRTGCSVAESAFGTLRRDREPPESAGWREPPAGTFPLRRFVALRHDDGGLAVLTRGLYEYGHAEDGDLTVTLLRAVGWLSRERLPNRPHPVGPQIATPGAQCLGRHEFEYAIHPYRGDDSALYRAAEEFALALQARAVQPAVGGAGRAVFAEGSFVCVEPTAVVLSALKEAEDGRGLIVRVFNGGEDPVVGRLCFGVDLAVCRTSLGEEDLEPLAPMTDRTIEVPLSAGEIATLRLVLTPCP